MKQEMKTKAQLQKVMITEGLSAATPDVTQIIPTTSFHTNPTHLGQDYFILITQKNPRAHTNTPCYLHSS